MASPEAVDSFQRMLEINSNPLVKTAHLKGGQAHISMIFHGRCASDCTPSFFLLTFSELCV
jgi:hypothetical protein